MSEPVIIATATLLAVAIVAAVVLSGWQGWLRLKERELERGGVSGAGPLREIEGGAGVGAARIEIADLKERIRKLEAIASGVDL